jgi:phospholipid/cholesterol/gamma-HCH transport system substrate-binding protein
MTDINAGKGTLGKLAKDEALAKKLDSTITRLDTILERLENGEGTAGQLLVNKSLYNNADATLASTHELIEAIKKDPKKYLTIHLKLF